MPHPLPSPDRTVVVAGCGHGGLSVIRSFGRRGFHVIAMTHDPGESGLRSRWVDETAICPHPEDADALTEFLLARGPSWDGALVVETNDYFSTALSQNRDALSARFRLVIPEWEVTRTFLEKDRTYRLAAECGVPFPRYVSPSDEQGLDEALDGMLFPVMVKPVVSHEFVRVFGSKLFLADDEATLRRVWRKAMAAEMPVVIAEVVPGDDYYTLERVSAYVDTQGDILAEMYTTKLRQTPPLFGVTKVGRTMPVYDEVRDHTRTLLTASGFRGLASSEFKRDPRDGVLKLIEVNVRVLGDNELAVAAGVDFPWLMHQDHVSGVREPIVGYETAYWIHELPEALDLLTKERHRRRNADRLLEPYRASRRSYAYGSRRDPGPLLNELRRRGRKLLRR